MKYFALVAALAAAADAKIAASVRRSLHESGAADVMIEFKDNADLNALDNMSNLPKDVRTTAVRDMLTSQVTPHANEVHSIMEGLVTTNGKVAGETNTFWISNSMFIAKASADLLEAVMQLPNVEKIRSPVTAQLHVEPEVFSANSNTTANGWNLDIIKAPAAWKKGINGKGVVVANIDTGVRPTHEALKSNFRSTKNWLDPDGSAATPDDGHGHGTHTMGNIAGSHGIGVAPGATWIACRGCTSSGCSENALNKCAEFVMCPEGDCKMGCDVVNNSWGSTDGSSKFYSKQVKAWRKAGIIPVFSNGNSGPSCETVGAPGAHDNVIGVGASGEDDALAYFSSKGPAPGAKKLMKPDVTGPGYKVRSAKHTGDTEYQLMSGTSMSAPHLTGVVALILQAHPGSSYDDVYKKITEGVDTDSLTAENKNCGGLDDSKYPNNNYGYGRTNCMSAIGGSTPYPTTSAPYPTTSAPYPTTSAPYPTTTTPYPTTTTPYPTPSDACGNCNKCLWHNKCFPFPRTVCSLLKGRYCGN